MRGELSVPYNMVKLDDLVVGLDSYFWNNLTHEHRKVLLIKPGSKLENSPKPESTILNPKVRLESQLNDLTMLRRELRYARFDKSVKFFRWKMSRFFGIPLPRRNLEFDEYSEANAAYGIIRSLNLDKPIPMGLGWYIIGVNVEKESVTITQKEGEEKIYTWLLNNDNAFREIFLTIVNEFE
jgi:hypothetical protein